MSESSKAKDDIAVDKTGVTKISVRENGVLEISGGIDARDVFSKISAVEYDNIHAYVRLTIVDGFDNSKKDVFVRTSDIIMIWNEPRAHSIPNYRKVLDKDEFMLRNRGTGR